MLEAYPHFDAVIFISALPLFEKSLWVYGDECSLISWALREGLHKSVHRLFILYGSWIILQNKFWCLMLLKMFFIWLALLYTFYRRHIKCNTVTLIRVVSILTFSQVKCLFGVPIKYYKSSNNFAWSEECFSYYAIKRFAQERSKKKDNSIKKSSKKLITATILSKRPH